jgi:pyruvate/2-oxoglutarate/acetoin dehydrogenase E1 component
MADRSLQAAQALAEDGVSAEVVELRWLRPLDLDTVIASVEKTGRLLIVEEQVHAGGWGATVISDLTMRGVPMARPQAMSLRDDMLMPYSPTLEDAMLPSADGIAARVRAMLEG